MSDNVTVNRPGAPRDEGPERKVPSSESQGFISGVLLQALKWIALILGVVIFIVTVVIITINQFDRGLRLGQQRTPISEEYTAQPPILDWYSSLGEIRGSTADETNRTFLVVPHIGYDTGDRATQSELVARNIQIKEIIAFYFGSRVAAQLTGVENRQRVKSDLTRQINRIMSSGKIRDVAFDQYQVFEF